MATEMLFSDIPNMARFIIISEIKDSQRVRIRIIRKLPPLYKFSGSTKECNAVEDREKGDYLFIPEKTKVLWLE